MLMNLKEIKGEDLEDSLVKACLNSAFRMAGIKSVFLQQFVTYYRFCAGNGERVYGYCLRTRRVGKGNRHDVEWRFPVVLAILSRNPDHTTFRSILSILTPYFWNSNESLKQAVKKILTSRNSNIILNQRMRISSVRDFSPSVSSKSQNLKQQQQHR